MPPHGAAPVSHRKELRSLEVTADDARRAERSDCGDRSCIALRGGARNHAGVADEQPVNVVRLKIRVDD